MNMTDRYDPHLWMDPRIWSYIVLNVRDALIEILPDAKTKLAIMQKFI